VVEESIVWQKSSFSQASECVEVAGLTGRVLLRESDRPEVVVSVGSDGLRAFVDGVKAGRFEWAG